MKNQIYQLVVKRSACKHTQVQVMGIDPLSIKGTGHCQNCSPVLREPWPAGRSYQNIGVLSRIKRNPPPPPPPPTTSSNTCLLRLMLSLVFNTPVLTTPLTNNVYIALLSS